MRIEAIPRLPPPPTTTITTIAYTYFSDRKDASEQTGHLDRRRNSREGVDIAGRRALHDQPGELHLSLWKHKMVLAEKETVKLFSWRSTTIGTCECDNWSTISTGTSFRCSIRTATSTAEAAPIQIFACGARIARRSSVPKANSGVFWASAVVKASSSSSSFFRDDGQISLFTPLCIIGGRLCLMLI